MDFPDILDQLLYHHATATRDDWNASGLWIAAVRPGRPPQAPHRALTGPYLFLRTGRGERQPYVPTPADLFSDQWSVLSAPLTPGTEPDLADGLLDFPRALRALISQDRLLTNHDWHGRGQHVAAQRPDAHSQNTRPYLYLIDATGHRAPWTPTSGDVFSTRWAVLNPA